MLTEEIKAQRLDDAIAVMQRVVDNDWYFDISDFYSYYSDDECPPFGNTSQPSDNECKTAACFVGYIATAPEFTKNGWYVNDVCLPRLSTCSNAGVANAVAYYFGWSEYFAEELCWLYGGYFNYLYDTAEAEEVSPEMVLNVLLEIKAGNLDPTE